MRLRFIPALFIICIVLAACTTTGGKPLPALTFAHIAPVPIKVARVVQHPGNGHTDGGFILAPDEALQRYLGRKFQSAGGPGILSISIEEAGVTHGFEKSKNQAGNFLGVAGFDVYDVTLKLRAEHLDPGGVVLYGKVLSVGQKIKISEHASLVERERHQLEGLEEMFKQLDILLTHTVLEDMNLKAGY